MLDRDERLASKLRLLIVGGGRDRSSLELLADSLDISKVTEFTGAVPHAAVPDYLNRLDIYVAASRLEYLNNLDTLSEDLKFVQKLINGLIYYLKK